MQETLDAVYATLKTLRVPLVRSEYDLHRAIADALMADGFVVEHEVVVAPRCRIDFWVQGVGIEVKRGKPVPKALLRQAKAYATSEMLDSLLLVTEHAVSLPATLCGKRVRTLCLSALWGIAL